MSQPIDATSGEWTYSEYARLPDDGNRYEVLDGEVLVTPAATPHHQRIVGRLFLRLVEYVEARSQGWVLQDVDLLFQAGQFLRPDLLLVPRERRAGISDRGIELPPALVVEILSPSSRTIDREKKPRRYLDFGVSTYWVVDPGEGVVWVWDEDTGPEEPRRVEDTLRWTFLEGSESLELEVAALVAPL
jgi:Uma2 family endonuclease